MTGESAASDSTVSGGPAVKTPTGGWQRWVSGALALVCAALVGTLAGLIAFVIEARWGWRLEFLVVGLAGGAFLGLVVILAACVARTVAGAFARLVAAVGVAALLTALLMNPYTFAPFGWTALASIPLLWAAWLAAGAAQNWRSVGLLTLVLGLVGGVLTVGAGYVVQGSADDALVWALAGAWVFFVPATIHLRGTFVRPRAGYAALVGRGLAGFAMAALAVAAASAISLLAWW